MVNILIFVLSQGLLFIKNVFGCLNSPYTTYRTLAKNENLNFQSVFIFLLVLMYFLFASLLRVGVRNPFLLTVKFNMLILGFVIGFLGMVLFLHYIGKFAGGKSQINTIFNLYSFTLLPTTVWFLATSLLYVFLPPPRSFTIFGKLYSVFYITFSLSVLFWKLILYYLTLRFAQRLDFVKILLVSIPVSMLIGIYSLIMYHAGVFRIPFI